MRTRPNWTDQAHRDRTLADKALSLSSILIANLAILYFLAHLLAAAGIC